MTDKYIGQMLDDRYELLEVIGIGGMAVVYKALCHRLNRLVAVKILKDEYQQDEEFRRRFQAESQAIAMLSHANIVAVYDISSGGNLDYIVMELIDGMTLKDYVVQRGEISWRETLHFSAQIAKALDHAHSRGVIHRDIKPHNIMVLKDGSVKVADFGIAQLASTRNTLTREALGSVHYISPEQARGSGTDQRTDIYSLGVVMYELLTGQLPYDGETPVSVAIQHINGGAKMPRTIRSSIPVGLEQIVMKAMEPDPNRRYATAAEMADDLEAFRKDPNMTFAYGSAGRAMAEAQRASLKRVEQAIRQQKQSARTVTAAQKPASTTAAASTRQPQTRQPQTKQPQAAASAPSRKPAERQQKGAGSSGTAARDAAARKKEKPEARTEQTNPDRGPSMLAILIGTVCVLLVLAGIGYFLFQYALRDLLASSREIQVPSFLGMSEYEISPEDYPDLQLVIGAREYSSEAEGIVIDQNPEAGKIIKEANNTITLTVSQGPHTETLPELAGDSQQDAELLLNNLNLNLILQVIGEYSDEIAEGRVIRTQPAAQTTVSEGSQVTLVVSLGTKTQTITVPDLSDGSYTIEQAEKLLEELGLGLSHTVETQSDEPAGTVVDQSIEAGTEADLQTRITLYVSEGPQTDRTQDEQDDEAQEQQTEPAEAPQEQQTEPAEAAQEQQTEPAEAAQEQQTEPAEADQPIQETEEIPPVPTGPTLPEAVDPAQNNEAPETPEEAAGAGETVDAGNADEGTGTAPTDGTAPPAPRPEAEEPTTRSVTIDLPKDGGVVVVTLKLDGQQVGRYAADCEDGPLICEVTGSGVQQLDIYLDGTCIQSRTVDFTSGGD